jgi:predicted Rossmann fold flavoprotein
MGILLSKLNADICVIGAGASGMTAALSAYWKDPSLRIALIEEKERIGQKILVTGNGRCNLSNRLMSIENYNAGARRYEQVFRDAASDEAFFARLGLMLYEDESGRLYPYSNQASSVLNAFLNALGGTGIEIMTGNKVTFLKPGKQGIAVGLENGEQILAGSVILATGSPASVRNNRSEELVRQLGDRFVPFVPALVPLRFRGEQFRSLKGIRLKASVALQKEGTVICREAGEVQFGDGYLGGICVMDLSRFLEDGDYCLVLDLVPDKDEQIIIPFLETACAQTSGTASALLNGILPRRAGELIMRSVIPDAFSRKADTLSEKEIHQTAHLLKHWKIPVDSRCPMNQAQICRGGVEKLDRKTLASASDSRVFYCGEIINVDGRCGGYNLHWAWISGKTAGEAAAQCVRGGNDE